MSSAGPPTHPFPPPMPPAPPPSSVLSSLYSSLGSPGGLSSWGSGDPCGGTWTGVSCTAGNVVALDASYLSLPNSHPIPSLLITELPSLTYLRMSGNQFYGTLPASWSLLTSLNYLDLSNNMLTGSLPPPWSTLTLMTYFNMGNNHLTSTLPAVFFTSWTSMQPNNVLLTYNNLMCGTLPSNEIATVGTDFNYPCPNPPPPHPPAPPSPPPGES